MVAYSFKRQFIDPILAGTKRHTMRNERRGRSRHAFAGDPVHLYYAMRTKQCRRLGVSVCMMSMPVALGMGDAYPSVLIDKEHSVDDLDEFAVWDGFEDWPALCRFWWDEHQTKVWQGRLIRWDVAKIIGSEAA